MAASGLQNLQNSLYEDLSGGKKIDLSEYSKRYSTSKENILKVLSDVDKERIAPEGKKAYYSRIKDSVYVGNPRRGYHELNDRIRRKKIGVISEPRIGSFYQSPAAIKLAYKYFEEEDVDFVLLVGGLFAGKETFWNSGEIILNHSAQIDYAKKVLPKIPNVKTHVIASPKDVYRLTGRGSINLVEELCEEREDVEYKGYKNEDFWIEDTDVLIKASNPVAYERNPVGKSHGLQSKIKNTDITHDPERIMRGQAASKQDKNVVFLLGGYHSPVELPSYAGPNNYGISLPSLVFQTPSMSDRGVNPVMGCYLLDFEFEGDIDKKRKLIRFEPTFKPLYNYVKLRDYFGEPSYEGLNEKESGVLKFLFIKTHASRGEISREFGLDKDSINKVIDGLNQRGYNIEFDEASKKFVYPFVESLLKELDTIDISVAEDDMKPVYRFRIAATSDWHLVSKKQNIKLAHKIVDEVDKDGTFHVITDSGDVLDGLAGHKGHRQEVGLHSITDCIEYVRDRHPKSKTPQVKISGNHDLSHFGDLGADVVKHALEGIENVTYLGVAEGNLDAVLDKDKKISTQIKLTHPFKGTPGTLSKILQDFLEFYEHEGKPTRVLLAGNQHKACMIYTHDASLAYLVPTLQSTTPRFMRPKALSDAIGWWDIELLFDKKGRIVNVTSVYNDLRDQADEDDWKDMLEWQLKRKQKGTKEIITGRDQDVIIKAHYDYN